jgi:hypothetical protein
MSVHDQLRMTTVATSPINGSMNSQPNWRPSTRPTMNQAIWTERRAAGSASVLLINALNVRLKAISRRLTVRRLQAANRSEGLSFS